VIRHQPVRPQWTCGTDEDAWPCTPVRTMLTQRYRDDHEALARHMLLVVAWAAEDLGVGPASLYGRFVRWSLPSNSACRVCGRSGHDVLPGVPPRLFPGDDRVIRSVHGRVDTVIGCVDTGQAEVNVVVCGSMIDVSITSKLAEEGRCSRP
jgi:hypothetical protein